MNAVAMIAAIVLGQGIVGEDGVLRRPPMPTESIVFQRVIEEWVIDNTYPKRLSRLLDPDEATLLRVLGSRDAEARALAAQVIRRMGMRAIHLLCVGCRSRDAQIKSSSENLIDELYRCPHCGGDGRCHRCKAFNWIYDEEKKEWTRQPTKDNGDPWATRDPCDDCFNWGYWPWGWCAFCMGTGNLNNLPPRDN